MKKKNGILILTAALSGFAAGFAAEKFSAGGRRILSPEKVLRLVKQTAKESVPTDGAWIFLSPHTWTKDALTTVVYRGGLIMNESSPATHYDFIADARTGSLLELKVQD